MFLYPDGIVSFKLSMICQQLWSVGPFLMVMVVRQYSEGGGGTFKLTLKGVLQQIQRLKEGFVRRGREGCYIGSRGCVMGALLFLKDLGTMLELSEGGFCTCWTQNCFGLRSDKSPVSFW